MIFGKCRCVEDKGSISLGCRYEVITQGYGKVKAGIRPLTNSDLGAPVMESVWRKENLSQQMFWELSDVLQIQVPS